MDIVLVNIDYISKLGITINEYLTLLKIYRVNRQSSLPFNTTDQDLESLILKGFLIKNTDKEEIEFSSKADSLFDTTDELFNRFYTTFPSKIPNGKGGWRAVSTVNPTSMSSRSTKKVWDKVTNGNTELQLTVINGLKKELDDRERTYTMMYLANIDTWLRNFTWEKWEDDDDNLLREISNEKIL